jgi:ABC-2 type transport system ATP-binding protein
MPTTHDDGGHGQLQPKTTQSWPGGGRQDRMTAASMRERRDPATPGRLFAVEDHEAKASGEEVPSMAIIEARGLTKTFGSVLAVDHLSFEVERGSVVAFLGPNGAGKTTTLRMLLGLVKPDEGTATIRGQAYQDLPEPAHEVGAVLDAAGFYPGRTARSHLRVQAMASRSDPSRIDDVLALVDLTEVADRRVAGFSLGMRQRLGLATALLADPEVLILDEPANGLDPEGVRWLRDLLRGMAADGAAVLISSHILAEVAQTADEVVILDHGRLITQSRMGELTAGAALEDVFLDLTSASRSHGTSLDDDTEVQR